MEQIKSDLALSRNLLMRRQAQKMPLEADAVELSAGCSVLCFDQPREKELRSPPACAASPLPKCTITAEDAESSIDLADLLKTKSQTWEIIFRDLDIDFVWRFPSKRTADCIHRWRTDYICEPLKYVWTSNLLMRSKASSAVRWLDG